VKYYAILHAKQAQRALRGVEIRGKRIKVVFLKKRTNEYSNRDYDLSIDKCFDLANGFIGYNKWTSNIVSLERLEMTENEGKYNARFQCIIRHTLRDIGQFVDGTGEGMHIDDTVGAALDYSKKKAVTAPVKMPSQK